MENRENLPSLLLLLLIPAPLTFIALALLATFLIAGGDLGIGGDDEDSESSVEAVPTLSEEVRILATVQAAPVREAEPVSVGSAESVEVASAFGYSEQMVNAGEANYLAVCSSCHGVDALGVAGLGKTLVGSDYVQGIDDEALLEFVIVGRTIWDEDNTTGAAMPARGGNPGLTDDDIRSIIAYIRVLDGVVPPEGVAMEDAAEAPIPEDNAEVGSATDVANLEPVEFTPVDISAFLDSLGVELEENEPRADREPELIFNNLCGTRYGEDVVEEVLDACDYLTANPDELSADEMITLLQDGSPIWVEGNTVHIPQGLGYPMLNETEIEAFVNYLLGVEPSEPMDEAAPEGESSDESEATASDVEPETNVARADRTPEIIFNNLCGARYGEGVVEDIVDACDYLLNNPDELSAEEMITLLQDGSPIWAEGNTVHVPQGLGYPMLNETEIEAFVNYIMELE